VRILDTDTCVEILRGNHGVIERRAATLDVVATTWMTACELQYGAARSRAPEENRALVQAFLETLPVIPVDRRAAAHFGRSKAALERAGQRLTDADLLIASVSLSHQAVLITGNRRHFERVEGLEIEDWIR
jgi:tRNA(fMet)-specific endonuclease VapC